MKILFLGQKPIGELCFDILKKYQNIEIICAVSNKSKDGKWWESNRIYEYCIENNIEFIDNNKANEEQIEKMIIQYNIDYIISVGHSWILSKSILDLVDQRAINLHLAKLPDYKGNYTYNHAILNQEKTYGVTIHWMEEQVDNGDYVLTKEFPIEECDTALSLYKKSIREGLVIFEQLISIINKGKDIPRKKMYGEGKFYSKSSLSGLREINNCQDKREVAIKSKAFYFPPFEGAYFTMDGKKYYVIPEQNEI